MKNKIILILSFLLISSCMKEKIYTVKELISDRNLLNKIEQSCKKLEKFERMSNPNCSKAQNAVERIKIETIYTVEEFLADKKLMNEIFKYCRETSETERMNSVNCNRVNLAIQQMAIEIDSCRASKLVGDQSLIDKYCKNM